MTFVIDLSPELAQRLEEEAARRGQAPEEFVRTAVEEKLEGSAARGAAAGTADVQKQRNRAALALLQQWRKEDSENPDTNPVPEIPPLSLREVRID